MHVSENLHYARWEHALCSVLVVNACIEKTSLCSILVVIVLYLENYIMLDEKSLCSIIVVIACISKNYIMMNGENALCSITVVIVCIRKCSMGKCLHYARWEMALCSIVAVIACIGTGTLCSVENTLCSIIVILHAFGKQHYARRKKITMLKKILENYAVFNIIIVVSSC